MHVSLDSALGRQRRLNSVGESVLQIAPSATAAYSLRSLTGGDPKVVRVRRDTDNAEQDFTVSGVSSGALTSFTNADYAKYTSDFSSGDDSWGSFDDVTETGNIDGIGGLDNNLRLAIGTATSGHRAFRSNIFPVGQKINFSARVFIPSTNSDVDGILIRDANNTVIVATTAPTQDEWVTVTANDVTPINAQLRVNLQKGAVSSFTGNGSDEVYLREITVTQVTSDGFVETWYDQSGNSNDAVQATAGSQPEIVNAGTMLNELNFDGTDDNFELTSVLGMTSAGAVFSVAKSGGGSDKLILDNRDSGVDGFRLLRLGNDLEYRWQSATVDTGTNLGTNNKFIGFANHDGSNASAAVNGATATTTSDTSSMTVAAKPHIGARSFSTASNFWDGTINELIIYNSDQNANRSALETNINSHYSIF